MNKAAGPKTSGHDTNPRAGLGHVPSDRMVILGSGGARIVVAKQLRASGGIWLSLAGTHLLLDPGPGALVRITGSRHRLNPTRLAGILLSHRHLDHSGDVNNVIEAMTMGGTEPRGRLFAPSDALGGDDPVVLKYVRPFLEEVVTLEPGGSYRLGEVRFECPVRHQHRGEVYGFRFEVGGVSSVEEGEVGRSQKLEARMQKAEVADEESTTRTQRPGTVAGARKVNDGGGTQTAVTPTSMEGSRPAEIPRLAGSLGMTEAARVAERDAKSAKVETGPPAKGTEDPERSPVPGLRSSLTISYIADTRYFPELADYYRADVVIMNVVRPQPSELDHLSAPDAEELVRAIKPRLAVLTHFGMKMIAAKPWLLAREMSERTGYKVVAASDGMLIELAEYEAARPKTEDRGPKADREPGV